MPGNIYYLVASLPHLSYTDLLPVTIDTFFSSCALHLRPSHLKTLKSINEDIYDKRAMTLSVVRLWQEWDVAARSELARLRAESLGRTLKNTPPGKRIDSATEAAHEVYNAAFRASSPLMADDILESKRWKYIDSLEFGRYFNLESLALYLLKLKVLERKAHLMADRGRAELEGVLEGRNVEIESLMETNPSRPPLTPRGGVPPLSVRGG